MAGTKRVRSKYVTRGSDITLRYKSEYKAFKSASYRCNNPSDPTYKHYGGRGIRFLLASFEDLIKEIGPKPTPRHTLDRIDNNGNYVLGNIKWSTWKEQNNNQRRRKGYSRTADAINAMQEILVKYGLVSVGRPPLPEHDWIPTAEGLGC